MIGYAWVSTDDQNLDLWQSPMQCEELTDGDDSGALVQLECQQAALVACHQEIRMPGGGRRQHVIIAGVGRSRDRRQIRDHFREAAKLVDESPGQR